MKRSIFAISLALALASAAARVQGASGSGPAAIAADDGPTGTLYVVQSVGGALEPSANPHRLVLRRPYTKVTTFLDRPGRLGSQQTVSSLVNGWSDAFGQVPPNAALQIDRAPPAHDLVLLELDAPRYDRAKGTLTFAVRRLAETQKVHLRTLAREADERVAPRFGRATLFIDDAAPVFGYAVELNLFGPATSSSTIDFSLTLDNSQFMDTPSLVQQLPFGQATTPVISSLVTGRQMSLNFPAGLQLIGTVIIDLPASGNSVNASVELPGLPAAPVERGRVGHRVPERPDHHPGSSAALGRRSGASGASVFDPQATALVRQHSGSGTFGTGHLEHGSTRTILAAQRLRWARRPP
jgi:hypothetical protein